MTRILPRLSDGAQGELRCHQSPRWGNLPIDAIVPDDAIVVDARFT